MNSIAEHRAFSALESALTRRRHQAMDPWLRAELALLALTLCAVLFWQLRVPLDGLARARGPWAAVTIACLLMVVIAAAAGGLTLVRLVRALRGRPAGPAWLALPCDPAALEAHFAWNARTLAPLAVLPAATVLIALMGLVHPGWILTLALIFVTLALLAVRGAFALGTRLAVPREAPPQSLPHLTHTLSAPRAAPRAARRHARATASGGAWLAMLTQDARLTGHSPAARARATSLLLLAAIAALPWFAPWAPRLALAAAFALSLVAAAACAEWAIAVSALHPAAILRSLPLGVARFWGTRMLWISLGAAVLVAIQTPSAHRLEPAAVRVYVVWLAAAALLIGTLGANLAVTLHPRGDYAGRVLSLWLALAMVASFIIPLLGWVLVLTATIHSARRLPRWALGQVV